MKFSLIAAVLASFAGIVAGCTETIVVEAAPDPPVAVVPPDAGTDSATPPVPRCGASLVDPKCTATTKPPTTEAAIGAFLKSSAVALRCDSAGAKAVWNVRPLVELYGTQKMFMMGEVHGSNEIGIMSALVLEQLASQKLVNVVGFEMPMDLDEAFQRYVDTGKDGMVETLLSRGPPNMFGTILPKVARAMAVKGIPLRIAAVDIPYDPQLAVRQIQDVATKLTTQKDTVLATLPTSASDSPTPAEIASMNAYFDHIIGKQAAICAELSAAECDRLIAMTHALWAATLTRDAADSKQWFARREVAIYYNLRRKMTAPTDRMFLHMGAFHTNKADASAGSRMAKEYALTKGQVFSVGPAFGNGSVIWYGRDTDLPASPTTITSALGDVPAHPFFVSTTRPSASCQENPLLTEPEDAPAQGTLGELYDGYIHYGKLTSEQRPTDTTFERNAKSGDATVRVIADYRARIQQREREALTAGPAHFRTRP